MESLLSIFLHKNHVIYWFQLESARRGDSKRYFQYMTGALVAQWVKRLPTDLVVLISKGLCAIANPDIPPPAGPGLEMS